MAGQSESSSAAYLSRFGMLKDPFSAAPVDPLHFYVDPVREKILNMLRHLIPFGEETLMVLGPDYSGKTALAQHFAAQTEEDWKVCQVSAAEYNDPNELFGMVANSFGMDTQVTSSIAVLDGLSRHLNELHHTQLPILIVDDAHTLDPDALEIILRLAELKGEEGSSLLRIILFANPTIEAVLRDERFVELSKLHSFELTPFDEVQTATYLAHRLRGAGFSGQNPFSEKDLKRIHKEADGLPGIINEVAEEVLKQKASHRFPFGLNAIQFAVVVLGLVFAVAVIQYQESLFGLAEIEPSAAQAPLSLPPEPQQAEQDKPVAVPPPMVSELAVDEADPVVDAEPGDAIPLAIPNPPRPTPATPVKKAAEPLPLVVGTPVVTKPETTIPSPKPLPQPRAAIPVIESVDPASLVGTTKPQTLTLHGQDFNQQLRATLVWTGGRKTLAADRLRIIDDNTAELNLTTGTTADLWSLHLELPDGRKSESVSIEVTAPPAPRPKPKPALVKPVPAKPADSLLGEKWLREQPGNYYTLQLLASEQVSGLKSYALRHRLPAPVAGVANIRKGQYLYVLLQGSHADRAAADAALKALPAEVQASKPWVRRFEDIRLALPATPRPTIAPSSEVSTDKPQTDAWLWAQDPRYYTIQLVGGSERKAVEDFLKGHQLKQAAAIYQTQRRGQRWYIAVWGSYPDHDTAVAAIGTLPAVLQAASPWVRPFAAIHGELATLAR